VEINKPLLGVNNPVYSWNPNTYILSFSGLNRGDKIGRISRGEEGKLG